jgi:hypothetical protein
MWKMLLCLIFLSGTASAFGQTEKFKAIFIYNFIKDIEWPNKDQSSETFEIAVYGESPIINELNVIASKKKVGNSAIVVKKITSIAEISDCKICYIPGSRKKSIPEIAIAAKNKHILIITDEASDYFGINFKELNQKLVFQISKSNIEAHGLKVGSNLIALGISVD